MQNKLINALKSARSGLYVNQLMREVETTRQGIYSLVYNLRKKGYTIVSKGERYLLKSKNKRSKA